MEIVSIFDPHLFAFQYKVGEDNEYDRLLDLWTDVSYLREYAKKNGVVYINDFIESVLRNAEEVEDWLENISQSSKAYEEYFQPLQTSEYNKILALQKGKINKNRLRLYAIKIDGNCFAITGGAIKMSQKMEDHPDTAKELEKLNRARAYLKENGVFDNDSFFELLTEDYDYE